MMEINIFYSWQMRTEEKYNKNFILNCIKGVIKRLNKMPNYNEINFVIKQGVTKTPGSSEVVTTIKDRITRSDIFIADVSVVNNSSFLKQIFNKIFKNDPFQNNNVFLEYGYALSALDEKKIIGILNKSYGTPRENAKNLPFDISHLNFPIEYTYSKRKNTKESATKELTDALFERMLETVNYALEHQKSKYKPFLTWNDWNNKFSMKKGKFYENSRISEIIELLKKGVQNPKESIRMLGLPGLGKTKLLFEAFESKIGPLFFRNRVLYVDDGLHKDIDYQDIFAKIATAEESKIVIIDNCSLKSHTDLLHFVSQANNMISLVTIDSNPEEFGQHKIPGINYILIKKEEFSSVVDDIMHNDFSDIGQENEMKIKEFSQGIPLMAVLLGQSLKGGERFIGKLNNKILLDKLLGEKGKDEKNRKILRACSIFNYVGIEDGLRSQIQFILKNREITPLDIDGDVLVTDFKEVYNHYLNREIFEKKGRLIRLRPFPLAISLAEEWLGSCTPERLLEVISSIAKLTTPDRDYLSEALAEQMKYLGYDDNAKIIIEKITGSNSVFAHAEVLNTNLGSRLFRSFVEVNPIAISKTLTQVFLPKSKEELLNIKEGRRNLVWVLEKLCFDKRTFGDGIKVLYGFAVAENESWSNNALNQFLHLFNIFLAGTEVNLEERWQIIKWGLDKNNLDYNVLAIKAMGAGLKSGHFMRMDGPEQQGTKKLHDYRPNSNEIKSYWEKILLELIKIIKQKNEHSNQATEIIATNIRGIFHAGFSEMMLPFVEEVAVLNDNDWDEGLEGLKYTKKYEKGLLTKKTLLSIDRLIEILTKRDFQSRYINLVKSYHLDNDESYSSENIKNAVAKLADEFIDEDLSWKENFPLFYQNNQIYSYFFGKRLYERIERDYKKRNEFLDLSILVVLKIEKKVRNLAVLEGFILESTEELKYIFYNILISKKELNYLLFYFISRDKNGKKFFHLIFDLLDEKKSTLEDFDWFIYWALDRCDINELGDFSKKVFSYGEEGYRIIFRLYFKLGYNNKEREIALLPVLKQCILKIGLWDNNEAYMDKHRWVEAICLILKSDEDEAFAIFINRTIIDSISFKNSYYLDTQIQNIYELLIKKYFDAIWSDLSTALLSTNEDYAKFYGLKSILGSSLGGLRRSIGVLFDGNIDLIFKWCVDNSPLAPRRFAELVPVFGEKNNGCALFHPITKKLIDRFGHINDVLRSLSANMGTYSWTGSEIPLLEDKIDVFNSIKNHEKIEVENWAYRNLIFLNEALKEARNKDAERYL